MTRVLPEFQGGREGGREGEMCVSQPLARRAWAPARIRTCGTSVKAMQVRAPSLAKHESVRSLDFAL